MGSAGRTIALVVAAGSGSRAGGGLPKQYRTIAGKAMLAHALDHLRHPLVDDVRVVIGAGQAELYQCAVGERALARPVRGGATRQQSVRNGLEALATDGGPGKVLIHDAARPFLPGGVVERLIEALAKADGAVPVLPVVDSLARASQTLGEPVRREDLVRVQTPQAFRFAPLLAAHRRWTGAADATDDAQVARAAGLTIATVAGDPRLDKLTHEEDLERAERRHRGRLTTRAGLGFDVHALAEGEELWLGGLLIPHSRGLRGHSDADVVLHALTDALLGAIGAGDIGDHFPPSDPQWRGTASSRFLEHACRLIDARGGRIDHADVTIVCEAPRIGPHRDAMRQRVAALLRVAADRVSIKATTTERLGFTGRGEGIAAQAIVTVRLPEEE
ncbi:MAG TPA: bifunctional 2-C-methyl-D-erythritol 4-phosphate cytidylyltransferase/2-C-methyl-D-erythritol 2,4-cyclodiphosphate synthase [Allosphingosinicella sp.]|nr:bifunctional 2-C-methyl-D-erythritol 4-phosphate cytidylyltransferase/2-C-methyl-D-erythritol 2,4-cyclodiphosphate synthase [Allosphingosinicella sp.]